ncbi:unnamed protein product, partial [Mesorhabditis belari]|uniref:Integrator complex subunit 11 n=1 Tax=Mesorhabditis belari TaxID=2138241 RepID=A0AAF3FDT4_9BILA
MTAADIKIVPLGAGQDVGRSCILVSIGGRNVMLDCGMHMGYQDKRRFPDFSYISGGGRLTNYLSCVIISHFHLDHCGSLPHMSEVVGYDGPIYMTYPTKAIAPTLLEDYRKVQTEFKGDRDFFTSQMIKQCMKKVIPVNLHETIYVDDELSIRAFYAGHVLGAAMFEVRVGNQSILYTGDYNMTPDRHLGAARVLPGLRPDVLIRQGKIVKRKQQILVKALTQQLSAILNVLVKETSSEKFMSACKMVARYLFPFLHLAVRKNFVSSSSRIGSGWHSKSRSTFLKDSQKKLLSITDCLSTGQTKK